MLLLCVLLFTNEFCEAKRVTGYIITENSDTLYGEIKVPDFNRVTGGWIMNGTNLESFHFEVSFKDHKKNKFQTFKPEDDSDFKLICPGCNREIESSLNYCPICHYDLKELNEQNDTPSKFPKHIDCLRCNVQLEYQGNFKFHETRVRASDNLSELFTNRESFDLYCCPICGKVEFFLPEVDN